MRIVKAFKKRIPFFFKHIGDIHDGENVVHLAYPDSKYYYTVVWKEQGDDDLYRVRYSNTQVHSQLASGNWVIDWRNLVNNTPHAGGEYK